MLVFVDESGDPGMKLDSGSSPFFVVKAVIFDDRAVATACDQHISKLRQQLRLSPHKEFHFADDNDRICEAFLSETAQFEFQYSAVVLNKHRLTGPGFRFKGPLYKYTAKLVVENARGLLQDATVVIDKCGDKVFRSELSRYLNRHANEGGVKRLKKIKMEKSHTNNLLQLADMVCGAVARSYTSTAPGRSKYRQIVRHRELRVQVWPALI